MSTQQTQLQTAIGTVPQAPEEDQTLAPYNVLVYNPKTGAILYQESFVMVASKDMAVAYASHQTSKIAGMTAAEVMAATIVARPFQG